MKHTARKRAFGAITIAATAAMVMSGCASGSGSDSSTGAGSQPTVGATVLSLEYPFLVTLNDTMKTQAAADNINLVSLDPRQKTATELTQVEDLITQKVNAIVMIPVDQDASQAAAKKINEAGIPLILVNTKLSDSFTGGYVSYIGSDDTEAGQIQGKYLTDQLTNGGNVIYLVGQYGGASTERRKKGFDDTIAATPSINVVTEVEDHGSRSEAKATMENLLQRYPNSGDVQAVVAQSDEMAIGAASAIADAGRQADFKVVIGVDGSDAGLKAVADGSLTATVFQDAQAQGKAAMDAAAKVVAGQSIDKEISIPFQLVTKDNLAQFQK